jgi:pimeloyl-ACP methyl ester carboxylesterase
MDARKVKNRDAEIYAEAIGDPLKPCVIMVMGSQASLLWWPEDFCEALANRGRYVLRFDTRDTGLSTRYPIGAPDYSFDDLADDVIAILDSFGIAQAQLLGVSAGGIVGQIVALKYPDRLSGLVILSSTPLGGEKMHLPPPSKEFNALAGSGGDVDWDDRKQAVDALLAWGRVLVGKGQTFDEAGARRLIEADFDRSQGLAHTTNHFQVRGGEQWAEKLSELKPPLRVLHGRLDPIYPIEHGRALAKTVTGATLVELPGGHGLDAAAFEPVLDALTSQNSLA